VDLNIGVLFVVLKYGVLVAVVVLVFDEVVVFFLVAGVVFSVFAEDVVFLPVPVFVLFLCMAELLPPV